MPSHFPHHQLHETMSCTSSSSFLYWFTDREQDSGDGCPGKKSYNALSPILTSPLCVMMWADSGPGGLTIEPRPRLVRSTSTPEKGNNLLRHPGLIAIPEIRIWYILWMLDCVRFLLWSYIVHNDKYLLILICFALLKFQLHNYCIL